ncbi:MAG TPA: LysR family transcriptional regulator [Burkholderiaceae bacterium]|nr:LysR family transcriptional regulator [Burkholderiaceae bacterium]
MTAPLDWNDLHCFVCAAQSRSLAGAARALGVNHATVGRRLSALEKALGAALFARSAAGLQLTPLGEDLLPLAEEAECAMRAFGERAATHRARVRLAMPSGFSRLFAPVLRTREMTEMLAAATSGAGLALLPCLLGDEEALLTRLTPEVLATREIWLAYRRESARSVAVRAVIDFVVELTRAQAARLGGALPRKADQNVPG